MQSDERPPRQTETDHERRAAKLITPRLFLGIPLKKGTDLPSSFLLRGGDFYLDTVKIDHISYVGKYVPKDLSLENLEQLRANILTLSKTLITNPVEPLLFSIVENLDPPLEDPFKKILAVDESP